MRTRRSYPALLALLGLALALCSAPAAAASALPHWHLDEALPAQAFPKSNFEFKATIFNAGDAPSEAPLHLTITAPPGLAFSETSNPACPGHATAHAIECTFPAGTPIGKSLDIFDQVHVASEPPLGVAHFQIEASGDGPALARQSESVDLIAAPLGFGIAEADVTALGPDGTEITQAGAHPYAYATTVRFNTTIAGDGRVIPAGTIRNLTVDLPPGYVGNPQALSTCSEQDLNTLTDFAPPDHPDQPLLTASCSLQSQLGEVELLAEGPYRLPVFNIAPHANLPAELGFNVFGTVVHLFPEVRPGDQGIRVRLSNIAQTLLVYGSTFTVWGSPGDPAHDSLRGFCGVRSNRASSGEGCPREAGTLPLAFFTNPTSCGPDGIGLQTPVSAASWTGETDTATIVSHGNDGRPQPITGCDRVPFDPKIRARQTTDNAESASGLDFEMDIPSDGLLNPDGISQANLRKAVVKLPEGVTLNPSAGEGLGTCSQAQYESEALRTALGEGCPAASLLGNVEVTTPLLGEKLTGNVFLATPYDNPSHTLLALYMVVRNVPRGVIVKAAGRVDTDPRTAQITTTFDDLPQLPFSHFLLHLREGARAPLVSPQSCGDFDAEAVLTPWSAAPEPAAAEQAHLTSTLTVTRGVGGGPCSSGGLPPFKPGLVAGTVNNRAGSYSPFNVRLFRTDEEQEFTNFSIKLPPGVIGKIAGLGYCSDAAIAVAKSREGQPGGGQAELDAPSCPASSQVGRTLAGAGVGSVLTYAPGALYYAGPYHGSAISLVSITAAKVGPFDLGTVVVRFALRVNPETAEIFVDATGSDPIPHIIDGITTHLRDIRAYNDRPEFTLNPTSCERTSTASTLLGSGLDFSSAADDLPVTISTPFQAADCAALGFKPKLKILLKGVTRRAGNPALRAVLTKAPGEANLARARVTLPKSEFLDNAHIGTVCTRVQFNSTPRIGDACPPASVYGKAFVTSPLVDYPLAGPIFLRSNPERELPDLVAALHAPQFDIAAVGHVDSVKGGGIRTTFEGIPDAPVSRVVLEMAGGKKGLLENSRNLCKTKNHAVVEMDGQNGKIRDFKPLVKPSCGKKKVLPEASQPGAYSR